jgi:hypothetical protein
MPITPNFWASYDHVKLTQLTHRPSPAQSWCKACIGGPIDTVVVMGGKEILKNCL